MFPCIATSLVTVIIIGYGISDLVQAYEENTCWAQSFVLIIASFISLFGLYIIWSDITYPLVTAVITIGTPLNLILPKFGLSLSLSHQRGRQYLGSVLSLATIPMTVLIYCVVCMAILGDALS